jgi:hypothetical protein
MPGFYALMKQDQATAVSESAPLTFRWAFDCESYLGDTNGRTWPIEVDRDIRNAEARLFILEAMISASSVALRELRLLGECNQNRQRHLHPFLAVSVSQVLLTSSLKIRSEERCELATSQLMDALAQCRQPRDLNGRPASASHTKARPHWSGFCGGCSF